MQPKLWSHGMYAAKIVQEEAVSSLSTLFREAFPSVKFTCTCNSARMHLLRMPLAYIRVGEPLSGLSQLLAMESVPEINYRKVK